jgi:hypothetical protein
MKKLYSTTALLIFGLGMPSIAQPIQPSAVVAQASRPDGAYLDRDWTVSIYYANNSYHYTGFKHRNQSSIELAGATLSRDGSRRIYTWNNSGTRYQIVWQPQDPDFIRVRVTSPSGKEILNRLLRRRSAEGDI